MMVRFTLLVILYIFLLSPAAFPGIYTGRVTGVTDGTNMTVNINGQDVPVRLYCIDAPQPGQSFGHEAKRFVMYLAMGKDARVEVMDSDHSNRLISRVTIDGKDLSTELVNAGLAWYDNRRSHDPALASAHKKTRADGIGIWSEKEPEAPWVFRRKSRGITPDFSVGHYGAAPASSSSASGPAGVSAVRKDYGFVPVSDQTCDSSFGISVVSVPALWPCSSSWGYGGFYGGMYGTSHGGMHGVSFGNPGGGLYISTYGVNASCYGGFYQPAFYSGSLSHGGCGKPPCGSGSYPSGSWGRPHCGSSSYPSGHHRR